MAIISIHPQGLSLEALQTLTADLRTFFTAAKDADPSLALESLLLQADSSMSGTAPTAAAQVIFGQDHYTETVIGLKFRITANAFFQVTNNHSF
jgi:hypothetical protein